VADLVAHGGELPVSAGGVVARIEDQQGPTLREDQAEPIGLSVGSGGREIGCG
jgi:hypothetical protein